MNRIIYNRNRVDSRHDDKEFDPFGLSMRKGTPVRCSVCRYGEMGFQLSATNPSFGCENLLYMGAK